MINILESRKKWTNTLERFESCSKFKEGINSSGGDNLESLFVLRELNSIIDKKDLLMKFSTAVGMVLNKYNDSNVFIGVQSPTQSYVPVYIDLETDLQMEEVIENITKDYEANSLHQKFNIKGLAKRLKLELQSIQELFSVGVGLGDDKITETEKTECQCLFKINKQAGSFSFYYPEAVYSKEEISRIGNQICHVFRQLHTDPTLTVSQVQLIDEKEKYTIIHDFNQPVEQPQGNLIELFSDQVKKFPSQVAIQFYDASITYKELDEKSNALCNSLIEENVKPGQVVAFICERSIDMAIGILGIMKSGAVYLPIDTHFPDERIQYLLQDSQTSYLVADKQNVGKAKQMGLNYFLLHDIKGQEVANSTVGEDAYIIYTSGSTGQPKGVLVGQSHITSSIKWRKEAYGLNETDSVLQLFSYVFDGFMTSFLTPIVSGATIVFVTEEDAKNVVALRRIIHQERITHFISVPALCLAIYENISVEEAACVKMITVAGDKIIQDIINQLDAKNPNTELINEYGPTECSVVATAKRNAARGHIGSIGKPIRNARVYIMDSYGNLLPEGVSGEIVIGGNGVARGYVKQEALTNETFLDDPYSPGRMYKTGDKGRWLPNGEIEFLGRIDHQVKISGYRIELQEIEHVIESIENVKIAAVVAKEDNLYAFYIGEVAEKEIIKQLEKRLPHYMIPKQWTKLDIMPVTSNGKIHYKQLKIQDQVKGVEKVLPANDKEKEMWQIWQELLQHHNFGVTQNFFEIGGNSLTGIRLVSKVTQKMDKDITLALLMKYPTIRTFISAIEELDHKKAIILEKALVQERYPVTQQQQGIYISHTLDETGISYNVPTVVKVEGNLDIEKVQDIATTLVNRHKILRTIYHNTDEGVGQSILDHAQIQVAYIESDKTIEEVFATFLKPFDLEKAPLFIMAIAKCGNKQYLLFDSHHIAVDGASMGILYHEFCKLYNEEELEEQPLEFIDYVAWDTSDQKRKLVKSQMPYWIDQYEDFTNKINLPTDFPRNVTTGMEGKTLHFYSSKEEMKQVKDFCNTHGMTLHMLLLGTYGIMMQKYTGETDVTVGFPSYGRYLPELENMIGMFINSLPVRMYPNYEKTLTQLLEEIKQNVLESLSHEACSLDDIITSVELSSEDAGNPLFNTMFAFHDIPIDTNQIQGLKLTPIDIEQNMAKFDVTLDVQEEEDHLHFTLRYNVNLFKAETMERFANHYTQLLANLLTMPNKAIGEIPMLSEDEYYQIVVKNNDVQTVYPEKDSTIKDLFERQVTLTPDAIAVSFADQTLSYQEVNDYANALAKDLMEKYHVKGKVIPIIADRSLEMLIIEMAIMKCGATFTPIDPNWPAPRINMIIEEVGAEFVMTHSQSKVLEDVVTQHYEVTLTKLTAESENPTVIVKPTDAIYIIYTSGSSGKPKGVEVPYRGIINRLMWMTERLGVLGCKSVLNTTNYVYDSAIWQMFWPLINGGKVVIPEPDAIIGAEYLLDIIHKEQVTITDFVPSVFNVIVEQMEAATLSTEALESLKWLIIGGEEIKPKAVNIFKGLFPGVECINLYGPTEASIGCIYKVISGEEENVIPIGKPISNVNILLLDEAMNLVPKGVIGEIYIAGVCLANGYYQDKEMTEEVFIKNPFKEIDSEYLYKTGDIAKWGKEWDIYFLGRRDYQVKIRGFRIELQEIEDKILQFENVRECIVIDFEDEQGDKYLCGYFTTSEAILAEDIRAYLTKEMPQYMVPTFLVEIDEMPIASSGKVDRKKLPKPDFSKLTTELVLPATKEEKLLADVWKRVLNREEISIHDNFFAIGGDSIKALQIASHLRKKQTEFTMQQLFMYPTIAQLAHHVVYAETQVNERLTGEVALSPIQKRYFSEYDTSKHFNQAIMLAKKEWHKEWVEKAFEHVVSSHDLLRAKFEQIEGEIKQEVTEVAASCFEIESIDILDQAQEVDKVNSFVESIHSKINLEGPLNRLGIIKTSKEDHLLIVIHHLIVDGVSWHIILNDFIEAYEKLEIGQVPETKERSRSYQYYVDTLKEYAQSKDLKDQMDYWKQMGQEGSREDYGLMGQKETMTLKLEPQLSQALLKDIHKAYHTQVDDVLLCVLAMAFNKLNQEQEITVDLESIGRNIHGQAFDYMQTVGWFTAIYPVKLQVMDTIQNTLSNIKENQRKVPESGIGYNVLRYYTQALEGCKDSPISFNYLGEVNLPLEMKDKVQRSSYHAGSMISPEMKMKYALDINARFEDNTFIISFDYAHNHYSKEQINQLVIAYEQASQEVVDYCHAQEKSKKTPSDFGDYSLSLTDLETLYDRIGTDRVEKVYPLSPMQSGMLFHAMLDKDATSYFEQNDVTFTGKMSMDYFKQAYEKLIQSYDIFRTAFIYDEISEPYQVVKTYHQELISFEVEDISQVENQAQWVEDYCQKDRNQGFDLQEGPLMRIKIFQLDDNTHRVIWSDHHILMDGWCIAIVLEKFFEHYKALIQNTEIEVEIGHQYQEYIDWIIKQDVEVAQIYWKEKLESYDVPVKLNHKESKGTKYVQQKHRITLPKDISLQLSQAAGENGVTLNATMQAGWALTLMKYANTDDVVFGTVVSGRPAVLEGVEDMVGLFINTLPMRMKMDQEKPFIDLVKMAQEEYLGGEKYSYCPLATVQACSPLGNDVFSHIFVFENHPMQEALARKPEADDMPYISAVDAVEETNYDLNIIVTPGEEITIDLVYNANVYEEWFVSQLGRHYNHVLQDVSNNINQTIEETDVLEAVDYHTLLEVFDNKSVDYPKDKNIIDLFTEQVKKFGECIAIQCEGRYFTYNQVDQISDHIAGYLTNEKIEINDIVGLLMDKTEDIVIAALGIMKVGAAYMPLDPSYPLDRLNFTIEDSSAKLVLIKENDYGVSATCKIVDLETLSKDQPQPIKREISPETTAYVIYTSGTTGRPKGVMVSHKNVVRLMVNEENLHDFNENDIWTMFHSFCFDFSVWEMYGPLLFGGKLIIIPKDLARDTMAFARLLEKEKVTILNQTPTAFGSLAEYLVEEKRNLVLRYVIFGGEALQPARLKAFNEYYDQTRLINMYGITETTVHVTFKEIGDYEIEHDISNIGIPIPTLSVHIVDRNMNMLPIGMPGEMLVSGDGVTKGYINRDTLNETHFIDWADEEGKTYRSGDLAKYLPNGDIEYLGRIDQQVQIRGHRIELGEIKTGLMNYDQISDVAVISIKDKFGNNNLSAYYVAEEILDVGELRDFLLETLPQYMVPSHFTRIDAMPLTVNGKLDTKALPLPDVQDNLQDYMPPENDIQKAMVEVWQEVLDLKQVGITDNYFVIGGDSIKAIQIYSRLNARGIQFEIKDLFEHSTIQAISHHIRLSNEVYSQEEVTGNALLTPIQKWLLELKDIDQYQYNQPIMFFNKNGFDEDLVRETVRKLRVHHDILRSKFTRVEGEIRQVYQTVDSSDEEMLQVFDLRENEESLAQHINETQAKVKLLDSRLYEISLFKTTDGDHLLFAVHHMIIDGVSWRILGEDFVQTYDDLLAGKETNYLDKTLSFKEWSEGIYHYAESVNLKKPLRYWLKQEEQIADLLLPVTEDYGTYQSMKTIKSELTEQETKDLLTQVHQAYGTTVEETLLASLIQAMAKVSTHRHIRIDLEGHGRENLFPHSDVSRTLGWFTTIYPVVLSHNESLEKLVCNVKEQMRQVPNKGIDYSIIKYLSPHGDQLKQQSQMSFNYLGQIDKVKTPHITLSDISIGKAVADELGRKYAIDISCKIEEGRLKIAFDYTGHLVKEAFMEKLMNAYTQMIQKLSNHCMIQDVTIKTPSDYGLPVTLEEFNKNVLAKLDQFEDIYLLTPMQKGMLLHAVSQPQSGAYYEKMVMQLEGEFQQEKFQQVLAWVANKFEALRTGILYKGLSEPLQVVYKENTMDYQYLDYSMYEKEEQESLIKEQIAPKFDFEKGKLSQMSVIKRDHESYEWIWQFHHIILDGWSIAIVLEEIFKAYMTMQHTTELEESGVNRYGEVIKRLYSKDIEVAKDYWKELLIGYENIVELTNETPSSEYVLGEKNVYLSQTQTNKLQELAAVNNVTMSTVIQTIWGVLLQKLNDIEDVVFGTVVSGRPRELVDAEQIVGMFINAIPVRVETEEETDFISLITHQQQQMTSSEEYSHCPIYEIQSNTQVKDKLITHVVAFENYPSNEKVKEYFTKENCGFEVKEVLMQEHTDYEFGVVFTPGETLKVNFTYNQNTYDPAWIENVATYYVNLVEAIIQNPSQKIMEISMIDKQEKEKILTGYNQPIVPNQLTLLEMFEEQVSKQPEAEAVIFGHAKVTYRELNEKANGLSNLLIERGIKEGDVVALMCQRSLEMAWAILGIMKSGAIYLPVDGELPKERQAYMLENSQAKMMVVDTHYKAKAQHDQMIEVGDVAEATTTHGKPGALAYIIYTSGSTGKPKGVLVAHDQIGSSIKWRKEEYQLDETDYILQLFSFAFDGFMTSFFTPIVSGSKVVFVPEETAKDVVEIAKVMEDNKVTHFIGVPALCLAIYEAISHEAAANMRYITTAGDRLILDLVSKVHEKNPKTEIINEYGPTECSVVATVQRHVGAENFTSIGSPIAGTHIYIMDRQGNLVPEGVNGEIVIAGNGVAMEYVGDAELTEEKFTQNPYAKGRMYFTGDKGRWMPTGAIIFAGRMDNQVKIRGYRIELQEIENVLESIDGIQNGAVKVIADDIYGYYTSEEEQSEAIILEQMRKELPDYMIPRKLLKIEEMPLTRIGKINHKALPDISIPVNTEFVKPETPSEMEIWSIWKEVLEHDQFGIEEAFYEIGGNSIKVMRVQVEIEKLYPGVVSVADLFSYTTVKHLSDYILSRTQAAPVLEEEDLTDTIMAKLSSDEDIDFEALADEILNKI